MENPVVKVEHLILKLRVRELSVCWDLTERGNQQR